MKFGKPRKVTEGAKTVAKDRTSPRPVKCLNIETHENGAPLFRYNFRVVIGEKTCRVLDWSMNETRMIVSDEGLDFSAPAPSAKVSPTVTLETLDENGNTLLVTPVSHIPQYQVPKGKFQPGNMTFSPFLQNSPNAWLPKVVAGREEKQVIALWQRMADSPDAYWLDGEKPTVEQIAEEQRLQDLRRKESIRKRITAQYGEEFAPEATEKAAVGGNDGGPEGVEDGDLGNF